MVQLAGTTKLELIPWDYNSQEHLDRMYLQRVACGWDSERIDLWKKSSIEGTKTMCWIVSRPRTLTPYSAGGTSRVPFGGDILTDDLPDRDTLLAKHLARYPKESVPLRDTFQTSGPSSQTPTQKSFIPIGHVATDIRPEEDRKLGLAPEPGAEGHLHILWIATLYISWAIHGLGFGSAAMRETESASAASISEEVSVLSVLNCIPETFQTDPAMVERTYLSQGLPAPSIINERWYKRNGYVECHRDPEGFKWLNPTTKEFETIPAVYLKKTLR